MYASLALWVVVVGVCLVLLGLEREHGCAGQTEPAGPLYRQQWQWWPPGNECIYKASSGVYVASRPSVAREA